MQFLEEIKKPTLIICSNGNKGKILKELNKSKKLFQINFMTLNELYDSYFFKYDEKSIHSVITDYNLKYETASVYLKNLIYVEDKNYKNKKLDNLVNIKRYLDKKNLLEKDIYFIQYLKSRDIVFYGFDYIDKFTNGIIKELQTFTNVNIIEKEYFNYKHEVIKFDHIENEVEYVASTICKLINENVSINKIKLANISEEYKPIIKRIFNMYNIPVQLNDAPSIYGTIVAKEFINNFENDLENVINNLKQKYDGDVVNIIINIVNKYAFINNKIEVKEEIIHDLKYSKVPLKHLKNQIELIDISDKVEDDEYVFMLNFNLGSVPKIIKDEEYLTNKDKKVLGIENNLELNKIIKSTTINNIKSIRNLIITYKLESYENNYFPSNLIKEMELETITKPIDLSYSEAANKIKLCKALDRYLKYNIKTKELSDLYSNYKINYREYRNDFNKISIEELNKILKNNLYLSYSNLQTYNECSFKYYIKNILKLDVYEDTFSAFIGTLFHHVLEVGINKEINVKEEINNFINDKTFNNKELFFINKLINDISLALKVIKKQLENTKFKDLLLENKIEVIKEGNIKVTFKGFIDKIMSFNNGINTYAAIIDYKTYVTDVKLDLIEYGLNIQLPIYLYLAHQKIKNAQFVGFYIQKVLNAENKYDENISLENQKINSMKLYGYSINDPLLLEMFDKTYENSEVINGMKIKKDGEFYGTANVLSKEEIDGLILKTDDIINKCINDILNAKFDITPKVYKGENISCKYCKYKDICFTKTEDIIEIEEEGEKNA